MFFRLLISKLCAFYLFSNKRQTTLLLEREPSPSATSVVRRGVVSTAQSELFTVDFGSAYNLVEDLNVVDIYPMPF